MTPIDVQSNRLVFDASSRVNRNGVMTITKKFALEVKAYCEKHGLEVASIGGNNDRGEFYVFLKEELTEEQAEELMW